MIAASVMKGLRTIPETSLSDFHLLAVTEFKMGFKNSMPRIITYKKFNNNAFRSESQGLCSSEADLVFQKTLFFMFSINIHLSRKSNFAQMKPLL